ncbi:MAG: (4Fe-4S)-binding protein, partial [Acinetobacter bohemicus]
TECVGFYDHQTCLAVCPIDCITPHPEHIETQAQLMEKFKGLNLFKS